MAKDPRYATVKLLIRHGEIKTWQGIFLHIPKSVVRLKLRTNNPRMTRIVNNPGELQYDEAALLASLIGVPHRVISELAEAAIKEFKRNRKA